VFAPDFPDDLEELPLPSFDLLGQQASLEGLTTTSLSGSARGLSLSLPQ
jgi:hypothetical protein